MGILYQQFLNDQANNGRNYTNGSNFAPVSTEHVEDVVAMNKQALLDHSSLIIKINPNQADLSELIDMQEFTRLTQGRFGSSNQIGDQSPPNMIHGGTMTGSIANLKATKEMSEFDEQNASYGINNLKVEH